MALALKRLMLITSNVQFAIDLKRALEALGEYSVTTVADVRNAVEHFRDTPQHLVLLDTSNLPIAPEIFIDLLRARQKNIAIVLAPESPEAQRLVDSLNLDGLVDIPVMARVLLPVLENALQGLVDTGSQQSEKLYKDTIAIETLVESRLAQHAPLNYTRRRMQASYELLHPDADTEAQPAPLEILIEPDIEGDTVRYQVAGDQVTSASTTLRQSDFAGGETTVAAVASNPTVRELAHSLGSQQAGAPPPAARHPRDSAAESALEDSGAFQQMLTELLDESTELNNLSLDSLFDTTQELTIALGSGAVPRWIHDTEQFIQEPEFLPPAEPSAAPGEQSKSPASLPDEDLAESPVSRRVDDPQLAQLALTMTQMAAEMAVEATVLARDKRIVAYAGPMDLENFRQLRGAIADDWTAESNQARMRFLRLPKGGADYMLHSRATVAGYTLTMIFAGGKHLQEIRQQAEQMLEALYAPPGADAPAPAADMPAPRPEADSRQAIAFAWLLADPALLLRKRVAEQLVFWLEVQLNSLGWEIHRLDVHQDFIYLHADAPGRAQPEQLLRSVMRRAQKIACAEDAALPQNLWADAYLVLQPGRDMSESELSRFLKFVRA